VVAEGVVGDEIPEDWLDEAPDIPCWPERYSKRETILPSRCTWDSEPWVEEALGCAPNLVVSWASAVRDRRAAVAEAVPIVVSMDFIGL
jgi:hypothetical protein